MAEEESEFNCLRLKRGRGREERQKLLKVKCKNKLHIIYNS